MSAIPKWSEIDPSVTLLPLINGLNPDQKNSYKSPIDVLALSCVLWEQRKASGSSILLGQSFLAHSTIESLESRHIEQAEQIRKYYGRKIIVWNLSGVRMTDFRKSLAEFLQGDGRVVSKEYEGLIYRLPEFWSVDLQLDELWNTKFSSTVDSSLGGTCKCTHLLTPVTKIKRTQRRNVFTEYYFQVEGTTSAAVVKVDYVPGNLGLQNMWDRMFDSGNKMPVSGIYYTVNKGCAGHQHLVVKDWDLATDLS